MKTLHLFAGAGGSHLAAAILGFDSIGSVEWDPWRAALLTKRFPGEPIHGDVSTFPATLFGRPDLVVGGSPCFPAGTLIDTERGTVPIEAVASGERVLTHMGRYREVRATMRRTADTLVRLRVTGAPPVTCTPEHPFYARKRVWKYRNRVRYAEFSAPQWVPADQLGKDWYVAQPVDREVPDEDPTQAQNLWFWYMVGRWLGDGWVQTQKRKSVVPQGKRGSRVNSRVWNVYICCAHAEANELEAFLRGSGFAFRRGKERTATRFVTCSKELVEFLAEFGSGAAHKRIPNWVYALPDDVLRRLWDGYMDADGWIRRGDGALTLTSVSRQLAGGAARIARRLFQRAAHVAYNVMPTTTVIGGRTVNQRPFYQVRVLPHGKRRAMSFVEGHHCWTPVRSVAAFSAPSTPVFNFEVDEDNSYVADSCVVHNCQDFSIAGKRAGLAGSRSNLALDQLRIVQASGAPYHLWENVPGALSSNGGADWIAFTAAVSAMGHDFTWLVLGANVCGASHKRDRVFLLSWRRGFASPAVNLGEGHGEHDGPAVDWALDLVTDAVPAAFTGLGDWPASYGVWPALRGQQQFGWEPPRLAPKGPGWKGRISALGDGWVPTQAAVAWHLLCRQAALGIASARYVMKGPRQNWPTPARADATHGGPLQHLAMHGNYTSGSARYPRLGDATADAAGDLWPTLTSSSERGGRGDLLHLARHGGAIHGYKDPSTTKLWATANASDSRFPVHSREYIEEKRSQGHGMSNLKDQVAHDGMLWSTVTKDSVSSRTKRYAQGGMPLTACPELSAAPELSIASAQYVMKGPRCQAARLWPTATGHSCNAGDLGYVVHHPERKTRHVAGSGQAGPELSAPAPELAEPVTSGVLWPTLSKSEWRGSGPLGGKNHTAQLAHGHLDATVMEQQRQTGALNPEWVEALMGWPLGWTEP